MAPVLIQYLIWQFIDSSREILKAWRNFLLFYLNYFSLPVLLRTYFSHWHRYSSSYGKRWDVKHYVEVFTLNMMSRIIGAILRTFFIIIGIFTEIVIFMVGAIIFLGWLILPFFLIIGFFLGIKLILP